MIARWKPVHVGHAAILETLCERADRVVVGIGSSNKYDVANPFTAAESRSMIELVLAGRPGLEIVDVPDLGHGPRWRAMVTGMLGPLDAFVTANAYVKSLLEGDYRVLHPLELLPVERRVKASGTMVRRAIARGEPWQPLVPPAVARFLEERGLVERFRREFGLATLALETE
jgi:nicotinamide-nucleotide adenylyltransferase